jgi:hypothetical protein
LASSQHNKQSDGVAPHPTSWVTPMAIIKTSDELAGLATQLDLFQPAPLVRRRRRRCGSSRRHATGRKTKMVTRNELFKSRFMNAGNIEKPTVATISFAKIETLENTKGQTDEKLVVFFSDHKQNLALNTVNFDSIVEISNQYDSDHWAGVAIEIFRTMTEVGGKPTPCIRVRAPGSAPKPAPAPSLKKVEELKNTVAEEMDDEIPF